MSVATLLERPDGDVLKGESLQGPKDDRPWGERGLSIPVSSGDGPGVWRKPLWITPLTKPSCQPKKTEAFLDNPWQTNPPHPKKMQWWVFVFCFFVFDATKLWGCGYAATDNCYDLNIFFGGWRTKTSKVRDGESVLGNGGDLEIFVHSHGDLLEEFKKT